MIYIASDHAGFKLKEKLIKYLSKQGVSFQDLGTNSTERTDYPIFAQKLCKRVLQKQDNKGILICGTGIGMSITANRFTGIRAALCKNVKTAKLAREHNDANVLILAGRSTCPFIAKKMVNVFLQQECLGGVYQERLTLIDKIN